MGKFAQQLEEIFPGDSRNAGAADEFEARKLEGFFGETIEPGVRQTLEHLRRAGFLVAVSSNNFQHLVDQFVERERAPFDCVLGCRDGFFKGRDHFEHLQRQFDLSPGDILFVGDSLMDGVRARESGVRFVGKVGTFAPDAFERHHAGTQTVDRVEDLVALLSDWASDCASDWEHAS